MAKGQMKSNKEAKKPKADKAKPKAGASAYKQDQGKGESEREHRRGEATDLIPDADHVDLPM